MKGQFRSMGKAADRICFSKARGGSLNTDPAALTASKGQHDCLSCQDALHKTGKAGTVWFHINPSPALMKKSRALACVICMELPICWGFLRVDAASSSGPT